MVKIGLFGIGHLGKIHLRILKGLNPYFEIVGIFDVDVVEGQRVAEEHGVPFFEDAGELLQQVDAIDIVIPTPFHFEWAKAAMQNKKHVFVEKPITQTVEESTELMHLLQEYPVVFQVGHVERFNPAFVAARPLLKSPEFIETHRLAQFNPRGTDVPVVLDLMIHDLDIILHVVQSPVVSVSASGVAVVSKSHDITNARLVFENGTVANLTASRISLKNMRKSRFFQRDAYVGVDFLNKSIEVVRLEALNGTPDPYDMVLDLGEGKPSKKLSIESPPIYPTNAIEEELKEFAQAIGGGAPVSVDLKAGHQALDLAYRILDMLS
ncbi:MAG: gfo/Idh/MocA family oxidoreductase [Flavobacteriia bacterium]|jgi:predicted dehydrogenase|nr:gfo/Idh/MocA family oxidoreductase [Flavobacteriia bacterium]NBP28953.1 gfo/Idh/MocA family oxidoreductase [Flavobacteriia bacterium]